MSSSSSSPDLPTIRLTYLIHSLLGLINILQWIWIWKWRNGLGNNPPESFNLHPLLMTLAFTCFCEAAMVIRKTGFDKVRVGKPFHATLHLIGLILASVGIWGAYKYHTDAEITHFYSLHSWLGIITYSFLLLQYVLGVISFYRMSTPVAFRVWFKPYHVISGFVLIALMATTMIVGTTEKLIFVGVCNPTFTNECRVANLFGLCVGMVMFGILFIFTYEPLRKVNSSTNNNSNIADNSSSSIPNETSALIQQGGGASLSQMSTPLDT
jgi:cytochrome b-561